VENLHIEIETLLNEVNEFLYILATFFFSWSDLDKVRYRRCPEKFCSGSVSFVHMFTDKAVL